MLIPYELVPVPLGCGPYPPTAPWAEPDVERRGRSDARHGLRSHCGRARSARGPARTSSATTPRSRASTSSAPACTISGAADEPPRSRRGRPRSASSRRSRTDPTSTRVVASDRSRSYVRKLVGRAVKYERDFNLAVDVALLDKVHEVESDRRVGRASGRASAAITDDDLRVRRRGSARGRPSCQRAGHRGRSLDRFNTMERNSRPAAATRIDDVRPTRRASRSSLATGRATSAPVSRTRR